MVDWKTVSKDSEKSGATEQKLVADLYTNPLQLAAYVAALNSSAACAHLPRVEQGAVVLAYESRAEVEVVTMDADSLEVGDMTLNRNPRPCRSTSRSSAPASTASGGTWSTAPARQASWTLSTGPRS